MAANPAVLDRLSASAGGLDGPNPGTQGIGEKSGAGDFHFFYFAISQLK
jgi:hypothetical protein